MFVLLLFTLISSGLVSMESLTTPTLGDDMFPVRLMRMMTADDEGGDNTSLSLYCVHV